MQIEIKNNKLVGILKKREEIHGKLGEIMKELMALDKEKTKLGYKMDKLKDKTKIIMDKERVEVGEYEIISRVYMEDGKAYCEVVDLVEEYKKALKEQRNGETK